MRHLTPLLVVALFATGCKSVSPDDPAATPQRPTISSGPTTTAAKTFELEAGATIDPSDFGVTPVTLKYGADERTEVFGSWNVLTYRQEPQSEAGIGDLRVGARHRFAEETEKAPAMSVEGELKLPTADAQKNLGTGVIDAAFAFAAGKKLGSVDLTGYYQLGLLSAAARQGVDVSHIATAGDEVPLSKAGWSVFGELAGRYVPARDFNGMQLMGGVYYRPAPSLVFDVGVATGFGTDFPDFTLLFGMTRNFGGKRATTPTSSTGAAAGAPADTGW